MKDRVGTHHHASSTCWACYISDHLPALMTAYMTCSGDLAQLEARMQRLTEELMKAGRPPGSFREPFHRAATAFARILHPLEERPVQLKETA